ncbi:hypothetical protein ACROYT_G024847 [Oculina patagonica]
MNKLFLLALIGFVLAIGLALPFSEDGDGTSNNDFKSEDEERNLNWDAADNDVGEDEHDFEENKDNKEDYEDDDDDDDNGEEDEDDDNSLSNPIEKSSDRQIVRRLFRVRRFFRGTRRFFRRFRG